MIETLNFVQEKKNKNLEWIHSENIYSHDTIFFNEILQKEVWDFTENQDLSLTSLSFLFIRSLLSQELNGFKIQATQVSQYCKAKLGKSGYSQFFNDFLETNPILGIPNKNVLPTFASSLFLEDKFFHITTEEKKASIITGGGILKEKKTNAHELIEKLFTEFDLKDKTGHFFLRTKLNSYLYLLNPENKSKTFYIQQKKSFPIDFQFYHIKTNT
ncbi:MAG: hypothetical protein KBA66_03060 [Leptospiraceae bacterium]|nr:hypothetical protein [Leptospiraceae bacterium]